MNLGQGQAHESHLGPASEVINISAFINSATELTSGSASASPEQTCQNCSPDEQAAIAAECSSPAAAQDRVDDLRSSLNDVLTNPRLMSHITKSHSATVHSIYETAETSSRKKRRRIVLPEPAEEHAEVRALRARIDNTKLRSWPLTLHAASFIRPPKHSDRNTLNRTKRFGVGAEQSRVHQALVFVSIFNKLSWGHRQLLRASQHVLLSSQTLGDLYEVIPCPSNELPEEVTDEPSDTVRYALPTHAAGGAGEGSAGCVMCIDETIYGDGQSTDDYSEKLLRLLGDPDESEKQPRLQRGTPMHDTTFASLSLRLHKPYWLLHAGNCEHFWVIDQIRLLHSSDPPISAYPLTTHLTPPLLDLCRACNKVPAIYAVTGDMRLGESPFVICGPCWRWTGEPRGSGAADVVVVPLPKHEHGWGG